ncbi:MFS transporter [Sulfobacillus sp. DSM 109850]|uniref:MFS transporter n=2 Tax=Sulfobacillus harzensis TaxID=2729629 RepID=A0A7Y0Q3F4_9FIRM|nr:MFS transporter [Sulfobacillus harzensis]
MLMENYIFSLAPIATGWVSNMPKNLTSLLLSWAPIWLIIGIAVAGPISDRLGRKNTFYVTMTLYGIGGLGLIFLSSTYVTLLVFLAVLLFASGGEMNTIMVASHEMMPRHHRSKTMMLELNFINLGGLLLAILSMTTRAWSHSVELEKVSVGIALLLVLVVLLFARVNTPESLRWLVRHGAKEEAHHQALKYYGAEEGERRYQAVIEPPKRQVNNQYLKVSVGIRLYATMATAFAGAAGFGIFTYVVAPYYYQSLTSQIIFVAGLVGFITGFIGLWGNRLSRKHLLLWGYLGTFVFAFIIYLTTGTWTKNLDLFWVLVVLFNIFVAVGYITEDTLKGEVWPTRSRGTYTALVRFVSIGLYIGTIYLTAHYSLSHTLLFNAVVWAIGASGAVLWFFKGLETGRGVAIEEASNETEA